MNRMSPREAFFAQPPPHVAMLRYRYDALAPCVPSAANEPCPFCCRRNSDNRGLPHLLSPHVVRNNRFCCFGSCVDAVFTHQRQHPLSPHFTMIPIILKCPTGELPLLPRNMYTLLYFYANHGCLLTSLLCIFVRGLSRLSRKRCPVLPPTNGLFFRRLRAQSLPGAGFRTFSPFTSYAYSCIYIFYYIIYIIYMNI